MTKNVHFDQWLELQGYDLSAACLTGSFLVNAWANFDGTMQEAQRFWDCIHRNVEIKVADYPLLELSSLSSVPVEQLKKYVAAVFPMGTCDVGTMEAILATPLI